MPYQDGTNGTFGAYFRGAVGSLTASNTDFRPTLNEAGLSGSPSIASLSSEYQAIIEYVHYSLGAPIVVVELTPQQVGINMEAALLKFSSIINTFFIESWLSQLLGLEKNYTSFDFQKALPKANNVFLDMFAQQTIVNANGVYSGQHTKRRGYLNVNQGQELYDIYSLGIDAQTGLPLEQYVASITGYGIHFVNIYHNEGAYINRIYDPYSSQQYINAEFNTGSYQSDIVYQILPLFHQLERGSIMHDSDYMHRSSFQHNIFGRKIELIPPPQLPFQMWFDYYTDDKPGTQVDPLLQSSYSGLSYLATSATNVATNFGNISVRDIKYDELNSIGRSWVREYCLALCMETCARVRGKILSIPIPGGESITLNYAELSSDAKEMKNELLTFLKEELDKMNLYKILEQEKQKALDYYTILQTRPLGLMTDRTLSHY